ncbi:hypothetical protein [Fimbriiglobus ruber]|uniref:hypothetical protein n=1 Tax=Fimbriiglobus ruber TaxID=1908690 RepID=UPI001EE71D96|nr:hypothetical protein [Fimbriiglobus ruber]
MDAVFNVTLKLLILVVVPPSAVSTMTSSAVTVAVTVEAWAMTRLRESPTTPEFPSEVRTCHFDDGGVSVLEFASET